MLFEDPEDGVVVFVHQAHCNIIQKFIVHILVLPIAWPTGLKDPPKANFCLVMTSAESMSYPETQLFIKIG